MTPSLKLPCAFFVAHKHIAGSPHLAHYTETSFQIIIAKFISEHHMLQGGGHFSSLLRLNLTIH